MAEGKEAWWKTKCELGGVHATEGLIRTWTRTEISRFVDDPLGGVASHTFLLLALGLFFFDAVTGLLTVARTAR
jgi:hypothetical protein